MARLEESSTDLENRVVVPPPRTITTAATTEVGFDSSRCGREKGDEKCRVLHCNEVLIGRRARPFLELVYARSCAEELMSCCGNSHEQGREQGLFILEDTATQRRIRTTSRSRCM